VNKLFVLFVIAMMCMPLVLAEYGDYANSISNNALDGIVSVGPTGAQPLTVAAYNVAGSYQGDLQAGEWAVIKFDLYPYKVNCKDTRVVIEHYAPSGFVSSDSGKVTSYQWSITNAKNYQFTGQTMTDPITEVGTHTVVGYAYCYDAVGLFIAANNNACGCTATQLITSGGKCGVDASGKCVEGAPNGAGTDPRMLTSVCVPKGSSTCPDKTTFKVVARPATPTGSQSATTTPTTTTTTPTTTTTKTTQACGVDTVVELSSGYCQNNNYGRTLQHQCLSGTTIVPNCCPGLATGKGQALFDGTSCGTGSCIPKQGCTTATTSTKDSSVSTTNANDANNVVTSSNGNPTIDQSATNGKTVVTQEDDSKQLPPADSDTIAEAPFDLWAWMQANWIVVVLSLVVVALGVMYFLKVKKRRR
jgi:hypothetical protein